MKPLVFCKQLHDHSQALLDPGVERSWAWFSQDETPPSTLSDFVPLVSKGMEFTPSGDTSFKKDDSLFAYYEVYEPLLAGLPAPQVQMRMKIINTQTGELKVDSGLRSAAAWMQPGNTVIPVSQQVAVDRLDKGLYRMEVQATDSAGRSTVWRTASFTVEQPLQLASLNRVMSPGSSCCLYGEQQFGSFGRDRGL